MKGISQGPSKPLFQVRILAGRPNKGKKMETIEVLILGVVVVSTIAGVLIAASDVFDTLEEDDSSTDL